MLKVTGLSKKFILHSRGGAELNSFKNASFELKSGRLLAVTGPSGIGKSSLLKCIYRTYAPSSGSVMYDSLLSGPIDLATASEWDILDLRKLEIGYCSQFFQAMPRVSCEDSLAEKLITRGVDRDEALGISRGMLSGIGLGKALWDVYPATFSGGEKQRLNILRSIITKPRLLLLDEPTASLDRGFKSKAIDLILALKAQGSSMIGVFHDKEALRELSDDRYDMELGEMCDIEAEAKF